MKSILENKQLRNKILLIIGAMILVRIGSIIPIPGVNADYMKAIMSNSGLGFLNMITGNSLSQMSFFALSISPYITASIIIQLMTVVIPSLEELGKDGKTGHEKVEKITNWTGIGLAFIQSLLMAIGFGKRGLLNPYTWWMVILMTAIWTLGAATLMFIGNRITKLDLGNGISYILVCNILSTFSRDVQSVYVMFINNHTVAYQVLNTIIVIGVLIAVIVACVILSVSEKRIPMTFSGKMAGRSVKQDLPIPLNTCGVMPIIFAGSLMSLPVFVSSFFPNITWLSEISKYLSQNQWFNAASPKYTVGVILYLVLNYFFASFYLDVNFNTIEIAQNLKQQGAVVPGIRPGNPTSDYLYDIAFKVAMVGVTCTMSIILLSNAICILSGLGILSIGGTSILICVNVIIESAKAVKGAIQSAKSKSYYVNKKAPVSLFGLVK